MRFSEIPGNEEIRKRLIRTVSDQRVSHAQLFYGPEESDKLALAIAYAQYINCTGRSQPGLLTMDDTIPDSCGNCPSCIKYQKLIHPDLHFIFPVATTKKITKKPQSRLFIPEWREYLLEHQCRVTLPGWYDHMGIENKQGIINADDCNEIITTLGYKSYESEYKVMVIWMVERLFHSAAPKLLKILEEPPEKTLFLLISDDPDAIIRTILSRLLMVRIPPAGTRAPLDGAESPFYAIFRPWMLSCHGGKVKEMTLFAAEMAKAGRERQKSMLQYGLEVLELLHSVHFRPEAPLQVSPIEDEFIRKFSRIVTPALIPAFASHFNTAIFHIERNAHSPTLFLDLSIQLARLINPKFIPLHSTQV